MKKLFILLLFIPSITFGQQFLWSTAKVGKLKNSKLNLVSLDAVTSKMLEYYEYYNYYYESQSLSEDGLRKILKIDSEDASMLYDGFDIVYEPFAAAFKSNYDKGSIVGVLFKQRGKVDLVIFSNQKKAGAIPTRIADIDNFQKWVYTFWGYRKPSSQFEDPLASHYEKESDKLEQIQLILDGRHFDVAPEIEDDRQQSGKVAVEIRVNRDGRITSAKAGIRGTTISNHALLEECEEAVLAARLNSSDYAPSVQTGVIIFSFKAAPLLTWRE
ncbi:energy transducer TonB [Albibacterium indicum]|uniref:energy transducer TonB n=1 Tax=Albibacterium indicum TaxID=2292082 RepID=UPI000E4A8A04|nr:hypothetical protein [Pedobacter indicus]